MKNPNEKKWTKVKLHICMFDCGGKNKCKANCPQEVEARRLIKGMSKHEFKKTLHALNNEIANVGKGKLKTYCTREQKIAYVAGLSYALVQLFPAMTMFRIKTGQIAKEAGL